MSLSDTALRRLAWASAVFMVLGTAAGVLLDLASGRIDGNGMLFGLLMMPFPIVGFVVITRRPRATLGWLMFSIGFAIALPFESYASYALGARGGDLPGGPLALALAGPAWVPFIAISGYLLLLFPDGHLPSRRWGWFAWTCGIGLGLLALLILVAPGNGADLGFPRVANPLGIDALEPYLDRVVVLSVLAPILMLGGAAGMIVRLRRATDDVERRQLRVLAFAACIVAVLYGLAFFGNDQWSSWLQLVGVGSFALIPIAIGIAVLRYRLYDIDVVIKKTLVFAVLAAFIAVVYVGVVAGVGAVVGSGGPALSALAAAIVALVFQPMRARARRFADRVVYGKRATPYEVLSEFSGRLAETYADDDVLPRMARVVAEGIGAERADVWLRIGDQLRVGASWPADAELTRPLPIEGEVLPTLPGDAAFPVEHRGELLGALAVVMPATDPMDPAKTKLVDDLAAQAGLVVRNVRLTAELQARLDDLRAAQRRIVTAQDEERRKLERNIHDGAQQQLVALTVKLRLAQGMVGGDPEKATAMLADLQVETTDALENLRDLARGIYPPLLADKGLAAALEAQARKSPIPVEVAPDGVGRYPQEIEAAVYFSCLEALQNVAKYAGAERATLRLERSDGALVFEVTDDGAGFDPGVTGYGTGLQGMADRLAVLDGRVTVRSAPGAGTAVIGWIPLPPDAEMPQDTDLARASNGKGT
jgi:signal transduction histidine kinase